jgi:hypothetical protein
MPWVDIVIGLSIAIAAFLGFNIGLLGALKGFISSIIGMIAAWFLAPISLTYLENNWGVETFLAELVQDMIPSSIRDVVQGLFQTARTLQEFIESLKATSLPPGVISYMESALMDAPERANITATMVFEAFSRGVARNILWVLLFAVLWFGISFLIKGFLNMIFINEDGKTFLGVFDGILGMVAAAFVMVSILLVVCNVLFPILMMSNPDGSLSGIYPHLLESRLIQWLSNIYQLHVAPRLT